MNDDPTEGLPSVGDLLEEYLAAQKAGERIELSALIARNPVAGEELRDLLPALVALDAVESDIDAAQPLSRIGGYRILREIGRGGMGLVYEAEQERLKRRVALKVMSSGMMGSDAARRRFLREAELASRLSHPSICTVHDAGVDQGLPYIAMEFIEGITLAQWFSGEEPELTKTWDSVLAGGSSEATVAGDQSPSSAVGGAIERERIRHVLGMVAQVARALHFAHEAGVVHRDIKPGNVMVTRDGVPKILDFGLARSQEAVPLTLTREGDVFGTPAYMAPEQVRGEVLAVDRRADVYALGVTLYEGLAGRRPFVEPTRPALYRAIQEDPPPDPRAHNPRISKDVWIILQSALRKAPGRRYPTALHLAEDLERVLRHEPILARAPSLWIRFRRWVRRRPATAGLILTLAITICVTLLVLRHLDRVEDQRRLGERIAAEVAADHEVQRGLIHLSEQQLPAAREAFDAALRIHPNSELARHLLQIVALREQGESDEAFVIPDVSEGLRHFLEGSIELSRRDGDPRRAYDLLTEAILRSDRPPVAFHLQRLGAAIRSDDPLLQRRAVGSLERLLDRSAAVAFRVAEARHHLDDPRAAIETWREACRLAPDWAPPYERLSDTLSILGEQDQALAVARDAARRFPSRPLPHIGIARVLHERGDPTGALEAIEEALRRDGDLAAAWAAKGVALQALKRPLEAREALLRALKIDPRMSQPLRALGLIELERGRFDQALGHFRELVKRRPDRRGPHEDLAICAYNAGRIDEALRSWVRAHRIGGDDPRLLGALGKVLRDRKLWADTLPYVLRLSRVQPADDLEAVLRALYERVGQHRDRLDHCGSEPKDFQLQAAREEGERIAALKLLLAKSSRSEPPTEQKMREALRNRCFAFALDLQALRCPASLLAGAPVNFDRELLAAAVRASLGRGADARDHQAADRLRYGSWAREWFARRLADLRSRAAGSGEREELQRALKELRDDRAVSIIFQPWTNWVLPDPERKLWEALEAELDGLEAELARPTR